VRPVSRSQLKKLRVLVVDDADDNRELYAEYLESQGFVVEQARDGLEALERLRTFVADVVLMDLSLPILDGWEATRVIKEDPTTRRVQVIALSGRTDVAARARAAAAGCDAFLAKPCTPSELVEAVVRRFRGYAASSSGGRGGRGQG
jgi:CheY-like chemotaxis protein